jgi:hypothetical protein
VFAVNHLLSGSGRRPVQSMVAHTGPFADSQAHHSRSAKTGPMADEQPTTPDNARPIEDEAQPLAAETQPLANEAGPAPVTAPEPARVRWQDRALRLPSVIAVGLATLIVGGFAGAGIGAWVHHDHGRFDGPGHMGHMGQFGDGMHEGGGWGMMPGRDGDHFGWGQQGQPGWGQNGPGGSPMMPGWGQNGGQGQGSPGSSGQGGQNTAPTPPSASPSQNG